VFVVRFCFAMYMSLWRGVSRLSPMLVGFQAILTRTISLA